MTLLAPDLTPTDLAWRASPAGYGHHFDPANYVRVRHVDMIAAAFRDACIRSANGEGTRTIVSLPPRHSKALALDTPLPTPTGWTTISDVEVGDCLYDENGQSCRVIGKSSVFDDHECYRVITSDGDEIVADGGHRWLVNLDRRSADHVQTTETLAKKRSKRAMVRCIRPLESADAVLPVDPYVLGVWLGDGAWRQAVITAADDNAKWLRRFIEAAGYRTTDQRTHQTFGVLGLRVGLREIGVLGPRPGSDEVRAQKHVPVEYLRASPAQRLALLQGLIDSDGGVAPNGQVTFSNTNKQLADDTIELVRSLGVRASMHEVPARLNGVTHGIAYLVTFYMANAARLPRKAERCRNTAKRQRYLHAERCESVPVQCIEVDSSSHLFLAGRSMTPTHNSETVTHWGPVWALDLWPHWKFMVATYAAEFAAEWGFKVRESIIEHADQLQVRVAPGMSARDRWYTTQGGGMFTAGVGGPFTGRGANCFISGTSVQTDHGPTPIEHVSVGTRVLSWDHAERRAVIKSVVAVNVDRSSDLVEITTTSGRRIVCTADHRLFDVQHGYRQAADLSVGTRLRSLATEQDVRSVRRPEDGQGQDLPLLLPEDANRDCDAHVRVVLEDVREGTRRSLEGSAARADRHVLLGDVLDSSSRSQEPTKVRDVRRADIAQDPQVLRSVPEANEASTRSPVVPALQQHVPADLAPHDVLLSNVRKQSTRSEDDRQGKLSLQDRHELLETVRTDAPADHREGSWLRGVRSDDEPNERASRRPRPDEQRPAEPRHALPDPSRDTPQVDEDTVAVVRRIRVGSQRVYDIEVEDSHNFFAEGVLVHNCFIIDDPFKNHEDASSETVRNAVWNWYQSTAYTRLEPNGFMFVVMTRWHENDIVGRLLDAEQEGADEWKVLRLPALAEADDPLGRREGAPLWPERFGLERLLQAKRVVGSYKWAGMYQQRPAPPEGSLLKRTWWQWYSAAPSVHRFDEVILSWDMTYKDTKSSDYVVGQVWGRIGADKYLLDQVRGQMDFPTTMKAFELQAAKWPEARSKLVEDAANGPAVIAALRRKLEGIISVPARGSKEARAAAVSPDIEAGNVYLPDPTLAPWIGDFVEECATFPNATHDDQVDAMSQALNRLGAASRAPETYEDERLYGRR